jgi:hypothetical protein
MLKMPERNVAAILDLANFFETLDAALYDQKTFKSGNRRCICGWCNYRTGREESDAIGAGKTLGINDRQRNHLFADHGGRRHTWMWGGGDAPTPKDAARVLRHLAVTGEIEADW